MVAGRSKSDTDLDRDVEKGTEDISRSQASLEVEKRTRFFNIGKKSSKVPACSKNVFQGTGETFKVSNKCRVTLDISTSTEGNETETETLSDSENSLAASLSEEIAEFAAPAVLYAASVASQMAASSSVHTGGSDKLESVEGSKISNLEREEMRRTDGDTDSMHSTASTSSTQRSCEVAREAARRARSAITACRKTVELLGYLEITGDSNCSIAAKKMGNLSEGSREYITYRAHIHECAEVINFLRAKVPSLIAIATTLEQGAEAADQAADNAAEVAGEKSTKAKRRKFLACWETNNLNAACNVALKLEYSTLKLINKYHPLLTTEPNAVIIPTGDSSNEYTPQCENKDRKTRYAFLVSLVVGIALLGILGFYDPSSESFAAVLTSGLILTIISSAYWTYKLYRCCKSIHRRNEVTMERRVQMQFIDVSERLKAVEECLRERKISLPSESCNGSQETLNVQDSQQ